MHLVINGRFMAQPMTGVQRYARELVAALDRELERWPGWTAELLLPQYVAAPSYRRISSRNVGQLHGHLWEQLDLPRHMAGDVLFCPGNTAPIASLLSRQPVVVTVHDLSYRYFPSAYTRAFRLLYNSIMPVVMRCAARVITVSQSERAQILKHYPLAAERLVVVQNGGVSDGSTARSAELEALRPYLLYVGSFSRRKNFDSVMEVARRLLDERRDLRFILVGGTPEVFQRMEPDREPHPRMTFAGQINDPAALMPYYRSAEALVFPSFYESSGLPPTEAMACGCPVLASDIPALAERCGNAALYCDPHDVDEILAKTRRLLNDQALRGALSRLGQVQSATFTWELCAEETMEHLAAAALRRRTGLPARSTRSVAKEGEA